MFAWAREGYQLNPKLVWECSHALDMLTSRNAVMQCAYWYFELLNYRVIMYYLIK